MDRTLDQRPSAKIAKVVYQIADIMATAPMDATGSRIMARGALIKQVVGKGTLAATAHDAIGWAERKDVLRLVSRRNEFPVILTDTITLRQIGNGEYASWLGKRPRLPSQLSGSSSGKTSGDADTNSGQNKKRPLRKMNDAARACIRAYKRRRRRGEAVKMKQHCREYAKDTSDSFSSLYRVITDNPTEWKDAEKRTK
jgi:hypothetical protein